MLVSVPTEPIDRPRTRPPRRSLTAVICALVAMTCVGGCKKKDDANAYAPPPPPGGGRPNVKGPINDRYTHFSKVIQHDGVVLPSQQGSPVYDLDGNVIGLNIARADRTRTFALSSQRVATILDELLKDLR